MNGCTLPQSILPAPTVDTYRKLAKVMGGECNAFAAPCFPSLWRVVKSEFSQLSSLAVPLLLHALSLPHGADIFWTIINGNFNSKDWKMRFEAGTSMLVKHPLGHKVNQMSSPLGHKVNQMFSFEIYFWPSLVICKISR